MTSPTPMLHQRLVFDLDHGQIRDGSRRYLMMRPDVLMGAFDGLPATTRAAALEALARSVFQGGGDSARAYLADVGRERFLAAMVDSAASLGWGRWRFELAAASLRLVVRDSPFASGTRHRHGTACHAIVGMLAAVAGAWWARPAIARECKCACTAASTEECRFEATPADDHEERRP